MPTIDKDCGCLNHRGPHWLYRDYEDLKENLTLLEQAIGHTQNDNIYHGVMAHGFAQEEHKRLRERQHCAGDYPHPYSLLGPGFEDLEAHRVHLLQEYEQAVKDMAERKRLRDLAYRQVPPAPTGAECKRVLKSCLKFQVEHQAHLCLITPERTEE